MTSPTMRVKLPKSVTAGAPFTVRTRITHPMHTGLRRDSDGELVPRQIINRFVVRFNGTEVFSAVLEPAISADPYIEFELVVLDDGDLDFEWIDDDGVSYSLQRRVNVL